MVRIPGQVWLVSLAAVVLLIAASAAPNAAQTLAAHAVGPESWGISPQPTPINPRNVAGAGALVVAGLLCLLFFYRRRLYILFWLAAWCLTALSMFLVSWTYSAEKLAFMAYGFSQFLGIVSALLFVLSADAHRARPRGWRGYAFVLLPMLLWFVLAPVALGTVAVFAPGHLLIGGGLAVAGVGHLMLVRQTRLLGAAVVGGSLLVIALSNMWTALRVPVPAAAGSALFMNPVLYAVTALGMQLMTFEEMTYELRRTNRRLESAQAKLRRMVITDPLTGCRNRRFFDEIIGRELQRHQRHHIPLSLLFVDVDRFKAINDTLGHDVGDRVLRQVAAFLLANTREADYVFRWGGDEFLILISCNEREARRRGEALQAAFAESRHRETLPPGVALSVGCAEIEDGTEDVMALVKVADGRMYENKRRTREAAALQSSPV
jgi:diguanylate cyclase (GGDEF)-like protein